MVKEIVSSDSNNYKWYEMLIWERFFSYENNVILSLHDKREEKYTDQHDNAESVNYNDRDEENIAFISKHNESLSSFTY